MSLQVVKPSNSPILSCEFNEGLVHQVITAYMAGARQGTKAQKNRSDVSGGGIKPWRQKGTGRARAGSSRGPLWRKGGVTFAARPRSFKQKVNRKMHQRAIASILSELFRLDRLVVVSDLKSETPKTRDLITKLNELSLNDVLIVTAEIDTNTMLAARNIPNVVVILADHIDPASLINFDKVLMTEAAVKKLEEKLS